MKVKDFHKVMEQIAPAALKESYDNVGLMVGDMQQEISKVLVALDCTIEVIEEAKREKAQMIFTHHPLLFKKPSTITTNTLQGKKIIELIKNDISLYSAHTNLDSIAGGMNDAFSRLLGFDKFIVMEKSPVKGYEGSGIGRLVELEEEKSLGEIIDTVKEKLNVSSIRFAGHKEARVRKIALINGSGEDFFFLSKAMGADCIITGDTTYHFVSDFKEMGMNIIDMGHFGSEWPLFVCLSRKIDEEIRAKGHKVEFVISKTTKDPYVLG